jgi:hypothetical protein
LTPEQKVRHRAAMLKSYVFTSPDGVEHVVTDAPAFCAEHGLCAVTMRETARGKRRGYRGWQSRLLY